MKEILQNLVESLDFTLPYLITGDTLIIKISNSHLLKLFIRSSCTLHPYTGDCIKYIIKAVQTGNTLDEGNLHFKDVVYQDNNFYESKEFKPYEKDKYLKTGNISEIIPNTINEINELINFYSEWTYL